MNLSKNKRRNAFRKIGRINRCLQEQCPVGATIAVRMDRETGKVAVVYERLDTVAKISGHILKLKSGIEAASLTIMYREYLIRDFLEDQAPEA